MTAERMIVGAAFVFQTLALVVAAARNASRMNPDGIAYMRLAQYVAHGDFRLSVSAYWGPLLSWMMTPFLALTPLSPLVVSRVIMAICSALYLWAAARVLRLFDVKGVWYACAVWVTAAASVFWSVLWVTPDVLLAALLAFAVCETVRCTSTSEWRQCFIAGIFWGAAYLAKAIALPLAILTMLVVALTRLDRDSQSRGAVLRAVAGFGSGLLILAAPWIILLSIVYGRPTYTSSASINHAIVGPGPVDRFHPTFITIHTPERGRVTSWEDPTNLPYATWSPLQSADLAKYQLLLIRDNAVAALDILNGFAAAFGALIGIAGALLLSRRAERRTLVLAAALPLLLVCLYLPLHADEPRFFYPAYVFLFAASLATAEAVGRLTRRAAGSVVLALVVVAYAFPAAESLVTALAGMPDITSLRAQDVGRQLAAHNVHGSIVGGGLPCGHGGHFGLDLAFVMGQPWHGDGRRADLAGYLRDGSPLVLVPRFSAAEHALSNRPDFYDMDRLVDQPPDAPRGYGPVHIFAKRSAFAGRLERGGTKAGL